MNKDLDLQSPLVSYLRKNLSKGYKLQNLKWALINEGYSKTEVDKAIKQVNSESDKLKRLEEDNQRKNLENQSISLITDEMPELEKRGFFSKIKHWFS